MSEPLTLPDLVPGRMYDVQHIGVVEFKRWDDYMGQRTAELRGITYPGTYNLLPEDFLAQVNAKRGMAAGEAAIAAYAEDRPKWTISEDGRHLFDEDFTHDVRLDVDGDWASDAQRIEWTKALAATLNAAVVPRVEDSLPMPGLLTIRLGEALGAAIERNYGKDAPDPMARAYADYVKWRDEHPTNRPPEEARS